MTAHETQIWQIQSISPKFGLTKVSHCMASQIAIIHSMYVATLICVAMFKQAEFKYAHTYYQFLQLQDH